MSERMKQCVLATAAMVCVLVSGCKSSAPAAGESASANDAAAAKASARDSKAPRVYATNEVSGDLTVIDSASNTVVDTIHLGKRPRGIHASPDGKVIYIAVSGTPIAGPGVDESKLPPPDRSADGIAIFDVAQNKVTRTINAGADPENFDLSADGKLLYVSNEDTEKVGIVDIASGSVVKQLAMGDEPEGVKVSPNGKFVYTTSEGGGNIAVLDTASQKIVATMKVGHRPRNVAFLKDSSKAYVNAENDGTVVLVDAVKHKMLQTITIGEAGKIKPMFVLLSPDESKLYVSTGRGKTICEVTTADNKLGRCVEVGGRPWGIALSPDGKSLYSANGPGQDVAVVDLASMTVAKKIPSPGSPWGIIVVAR